ncbi:TetR family transcriptional regulator [Weissella oryzae SG25]|uniref:TetR family transcriptional regulator n=1 Tax=Weissella oryzae (strain DSM 25784 / JCM 18191 / LMG 30913 / SG25) TaxID=1329250 RepID=A0A069CRT3_WEIOS|nr:TetR/AcrR family transcriptional regulator [Weissella oryzae]GAK30114.1 TetR family transcriptional regulator [Weissella oryzae SG25]
MVKVSEQDIFLAARRVLAEKGFEKARLADVARELSITSAALYKHFSDKDDLFKSVNQSWLDTVDQPLLKNAVRYPEVERIQALHDWLWELVLRRRKAYQDNHELMNYYENRLAQEGQLIPARLMDFAKAVETIMAWNTFRRQRGLTIMQTLTYFYHPFFADKWDDSLLQTLFESTWLELLPIVKQDLTLDGE